jgi:predicted amidohydrolase YtcJ
MLGTANEIPAVFAVIEPVFARLGGHPLEQAARYVAEMASVGITAAAETGYVKRLRDGYVALCGQPSMPLRVMLYEQLTEQDPAGPFESPVDPAMLRKQGVKIFADGTPWLGTAATSFPYLDTEPVRRSRFPFGLHPRERALNYDRATFDRLLEPAAAAGLQVACHVNGDIAIDFVLDAYRDVLGRHGLLDTDHRWRVEHIGAVRVDQLERMADLGVVPTFGLFQFMQWGDLLDGQMYAPDHGGPWCRTGDAERLGLRQSYHNDGSISRPLPLANVQAAVTRRSNSRRADGTYGWADGQVHGADQAVSLDEALRAITINAAYCVHREHELGSLEPGKLADFVELAEDPHDVDPTEIVQRCAVRATWLGGHKVDTDRFVADVAGLESTPDHHTVRTKALGCHHR